MAGTNSQESPHGIRRAKGEGKRREAKKEIDQIRIRKSENGGHTVVHDYKRPAQRGDKYIPAPESGEFSFGPGQHKEMWEHITKHLGIEKPKAEGEELEDDEGDEE